MSSSPSVVLALADQKDASLAEKRLVGLSRCRMCLRYKDDLSNIRIARVRKNEPRLLLTLGCCWPVRQLLKHVRIAHLEFDRTRASEIACIDPGTRATT